MNMKNIFSETVVHPTPFACGTPAGALLDHHLEDLRTLYAKALRTEKPALILGLKALIDRHV